MNKLTVGSFKREGVAGSFGHYFSHTLEDGMEVCLEACMEGYDVALYDKNKNIVVEKVCTKIGGMLDTQIVGGFSILTGEALTKAVSIANKMVENFYKQKPPAGESGL